VIELRFTTLGGVVGPGEPILDFVPAEARLLVEARMRPQDIDDVAVGQEARVLLSAYRQRNLPQIHGVVRDVSADRLVDDRSGEPYFLARVEVAPGELARVASSSGVDVSLAAGMPAEVMIVTGERTALDYLFQPFADSLRRSFKES
jgi:membrane fusion protein, type I secretion system